MSMRENFTAVVVQGEVWSGRCESQPYEAPWASEAVLFLRVLDGSVVGDGAFVRVQVSPDGMHWADEGTKVRVPKHDEVSFAKISHFGQYLRLAAHLPDGVSVTLLATLNLKS